MNGALISSRIWPTVVAECSRFWLRRHRLIVLFATAVLAGGLALRVAGDTERSEVLMSLLFAYLPFGAGLLTMSGIVADERSSGVILLWYQKPGSIVRSYGTRYGIQQGMLAALALTIWLTLITLHRFGLIPLPEPSRILVVLLVLAWLPAAIVFAFSAWGVRRDSAVAFLAIAGSIVVVASLSFADSMARDVIVAVSFPIDSMQELVKVPIDALLLPLVHVFGQIIGWTGIGLLGLAYTQRVLHRDV